jgi:uncharacterized protein (DUF2252 family)
MPLKALPIHPVLPGADDRSYHSLRIRPISRARRFLLGRQLRQQLPRAALGHWQPDTHRPDPVAQIIHSHEGRLASLISIRVARMAASPYGFLRGAANVMASDLARLRTTGITPVICGDAHLGNFGLYASPERDLVIDLNDFDEAHPGPWEWDLRRLAVSLWIAGRQSGLTESRCSDAVMACVGSYRQSLRFLSKQPLLWRSFQRVNVDQLNAQVKERSLRERITQAVALAKTRTSDRSLPRYTAVKEAGRRIVDHPPLITRVSGKSETQALDNYLATLAPHWRRVVAGYTLVDIAHKVVGVSSVGLRSYIALLEGSSPNDVLFLQLKQARRSVVARYVHGDTARHAHQGQRVVEYQQALQTVSDPLLGWTTVNGVPYYVRQFRDMKGAIPVDDIGPGALQDYATILGQLLAKGHARTSGASLISGYAGSSTRLDDAMRRFARAYADQIEADYEVLVRAVARGVLPVEAAEGKT